MLLSTTHHPEIAISSVGKQAVLEAMVAFLDLTTGPVKTDCWADSFDFGSLFFFLEQSE
jgi:hypothetical protein